MLVQSSLPPQSHFDDCIIHLLLCEVFQCHGRGGFEEGWMKWFEESTVLFYEVNDILLPERIRRSLGSVL